MVGQGAPLEEGLRTKREAGYTLAENVEIVDKNHNQSDPISGHVRNIRLRSSRPAKNNRRPTGLSPAAEDADGGD